MSRRPMSHRTMAPTTLRASRVSTGMAFWMKAWMSMSAVSFRAPPQPGQRREHVEHGGEVLLGETEASRGGEHLVDETSGGQWHSDSPALLEGQAQILLHELHVEQGLRGHVEHEGPAVLEHGRGGHSLEQRVHGL